MATKSTPPVEPDLPVEVDGPAVADPVTTALVEVGDDPGTVYQRALEAIAGADVDVLRPIAEAAVLLFQSGVRIDAGVDGFMVNLLRTRLFG